ncbi:MAG: DMT family transporter [Thermoplasmata archaeon]
MSGFGEGAALAASVLWTFTSLAFTVASRRIGPFAVNMWRMLFASGLLLISHIAILGSPAPAANGAQWLYLSLSGVIGLAIGDLGYFASLMIIGPRRGTLLMAINPIFSVVLGIFALRELLSAWTIAGIALTLAGVSWVILEREENSFEPALSRRQKALGVMAGVVGSAGQGVGLVLSKYGMINASDTGPLSPLSASLIRMLAATIFFALFVSLTGRLGKMREALGDRKGMGMTAAGTLIGPFLGVWISMVAVANADAGVAATLMSLMPVFVIPVVWVVYGQRTSARGILGALVAFSGVAVLMLL